MKSDIKMMRFLVSCFFLAFVPLLQAQEKLEVNISFEVRGNGMIETGSHFLSDAHQPASPGILWNLHFFDYHGLSAGLGIARGAYKITRPEVIGAFESTRMVYRFAEMAYTVRPAQKLSLRAEMGLGSVQMPQRANDRRFGTMRGIGTHAGLHAGYNVTNWLALTAGATYFYHRMSTKAPAEFSNYFRHAQQIWVGGGLKFTVFQSSRVPRAPKGNRTRYIDEKRRLQSDEE